MDGRNISNPGTEPVVADKTDLPSVRDIARRPFFAAALNRSAIGEYEPQTEVDLIQPGGPELGSTSTPKALPSDSGR